MKLFRLILAIALMLTAVGFEWVGHYEQATFFLLFSWYTYWMIDNAAKSV